MLARRRSAPSANAQLMSGSEEPSSTSIPQPQRSTEQLLSQRPRRHRANDVGSDNVLLRASDVTSVVGTKKRAIALTRTIPSTRNAARAFSPTTTSLSEISHRKARNGRTGAPIREHRHKRRGSQRTGQQLTGRTASTTPTTEPNSAGLNERNARRPLRRTRRVRSRASEHAPTRH